jgi:predicted permease
VSQLALANVSTLVERVLERRVPGGLAAFDMDLGVWLAASACGFLVTIMFTLAPLAAAWGTKLSPGLSSGARGVANSAGARRSHSALIGIEVAASLTLLAGAALMAESAVRMLRVDFGVEADRVVTASLAMRDRAFPDDASRGAFFDRLTSQLAGTGGATSMALGDWWPLQGSRPRRVDTGGATPTVASANPFAVSVGYFDTLGMSIRDGRAFSPQDRIGTPPVVIISESLARRLWPGQRAVGNQLTMYADDGSAATREVVGVVNNVRQSHTDDDLNDAYLSLAQRPSRFAFIYLRAPSASVGEQELRRAVARVDPEVAVGAPRALTLGLEQERTRPQFLASLLTVFAILASVLALVGMHGVIAYAVRQRQREIAVRMAVGATSGAVISMFVRDGLWVLTGGVIVGLAGAAGLGRVLQSQLHGLQPVEPRILAAASVAFVLCGLAAIGGPARRAAATDPSLVLKEE